MTRVVLCPRCSLPCRVGGKPSNPDARPLRLAKTAKEGLCPNCAFTAFVLSVETLDFGVSKNGPEMFLSPHVQKGFAKLFAIGNSDADISEIDWQSVVENWTLPIPKPTKKGTAF